MTSKTQKPTAVEKKISQRRTNFPPRILSTSKIRNWYHRDHVTHSTSVPPPSFFSSPSKSAMCYHFCFALKKLPCCLPSLSWTVLVRLKCVTLPRREHENQRLLNSEVSVPWPVTMEADASSYLLVATGLHPDSKKGPASISLHPLTNLSALQ